MPEYIIAAHYMTDDIVSMTRNYTLLGFVQQIHNKSDQDFYHAMHYSAKRGLEIACRLSVTLLDHDHIG